MVKVWRKIGEAKTFAAGYKKSMINQYFEDPDSGEIVGRDLFFSPVVACMMLPITEDGRVIAVKQFRFGVNQAVLELPAGGIDHGETPSEAGNRELREESGYMAKEIVQLTSGVIFPDPAACSWGYYPLLGQGCFYEGCPSPDRHEKIEIFLIPLEEWIEKIYSGESRSNLAIATTLLASHTLKNREPIRFSF